MKQVKRKPAAHHTQQTKTETETETRLFKFVAMIMC